MSSTGADWDELLTELELTADTPAEEVRARFEEERERRQEGTNHQVKPVRQRFKAALAKLEGFEATLQEREKSEVFGSRLKEIEQVIAAGQKGRAEILLEDLENKAKAASADSILLEIKALRAECRPAPPEPAPPPTPEPPRPPPSPEPPPPEAPPKPKPAKPATAVPQKPASATVAPISVTPRAGESVRRVTLALPDGRLHLLTDDSVNAGRTADNDLILFAVVPGNSKKTAALTRAISRRQMQIAPSAEKLTVIDGGADEAGQWKPSAMGTAFDGKLGERHEIKAGKSGVLSVSPDPETYAMPGWKVEWLPAPGWGKKFGGVACWRTDIGDSFAFVWGSVRSQDLHLKGKGSIDFTNGSLSASPNWEVGQEWLQAKVLSVGDLYPCKLEDLYYS